MDEAEWLASDDPEWMLEFLRGKGSLRKVRLFATSCVRRIWHSLTDPRSIQALEAAERCAEGALPLAALKRVYANASRAAQRFTDYGVAFTAARAAADAARYYEPEVLLDVLPVAAAAAAGCASTVCPEEGPLQADLLRCIFGNPFRPIILDPAWLTADVTALAHTAYDNRHLPSGELEPARLTNLADALHDAGCSSTILLDHLRQPGPHVRGCWAVDLVLAKE
jgi:hypothetical protein